MEFLFSCCCISSVYVLCQRIQSVCNLAKSTVCTANQLKLIGIFLPWHAARQPEGCLWQSVQSVLSLLWPGDLSAYTISVYTYMYIEMYKHNYTRGTDFKAASLLPANIFGRQRSSMHHEQDVSRKLLSHNGPTSSSETFVQIYIKMYLSCCQTGRGCGRRYRNTWLESSDATGNSSMSSTSVGHIRDRARQALRQHFSPEPEIAYKQLEPGFGAGRSAGCLARKRCKTERDLPANEEQRIRE